MIPEMSKNHTVTN